MIDEAAWGDVVELLRAAAREEILPRFRKLKPGMVREKSSPADLVTEADEAAEVMITRGLHRRFPGCLVVGGGGLRRQSGAAGPVGIGGVGLRGGPNRWHLQLRRRVAALRCNGCRGGGRAGRGGAILDPILDDTAMAIRGGGAWLSAPGAEPVRLGVAAPVPVGQMAGCVSWRFMKEPMRSTVLRNLPGLGGVCDYRCAAHEYRMLAAGQCDYLVFNRLMPWDHLPGWLLHQEAGGFSAHFDGSPLGAGDTTGGLICTPDRASFDAMAALLFAGP